MHTLPTPFHWLAFPRIEDEFHRRHSSGWLAQHLPEVDCLFGVPQNPVYHPEIDTGIHVGMCLAAAERMGVSDSARLAVLLHDLGKGITPPSEWPKHVDHETTGIPLVITVCERIDASDYQAMLCAKVCEYHLHAHPGRIGRAGTMLKFFRNAGLLDSTVPSQYVEDFFYACLCDFLGRGGDEAEHRTSVHHDRMIQVCNDIRESCLIEKLEAEKDSTGPYFQVLSAIHQKIQSDVLDHLA